MKIKICLNRHLICLKIFKSGIYSLEDDVNKPSFERNS